ncbi:M15 family metallopeptidase [Marinococcus halophilus]|uniref:Putative carboxypeptidase YodJ n=1 Tax=Marinococcus halophilus TaxID=1371 RepID=A0A510YC77_MARHA|nr:M15 family metallopeptidase [Marinococcus halophilus]GEK60251.1 putative carboxypeptidase YodJ [Marinococcus halophilus]
MKKWMIAAGTLGLLVSAGCANNESGENGAGGNEESSSGSSEENTEESQEDPENGSEETTDANKNDGQTEPGEAPPETSEEGDLKNPSAIDALINREYHLPADYEPENLVIPDVAFPFEGDLQKKYMREEAAAQLESMFAEAEEEEIELSAVSGYRSYDRQASIFAANAEEDGEEEANKYSARAGESEHQSGLAMDVSASSVGYSLTTELGDTEEGKWLEENAHEYGFVVRYPEDKTEITGYQYEPWHVRYVGEDLAEKLHENDLVMEEYYRENK